MNEPIYPKFKEYTKELRNKFDMLKGPMVYDFVSENDCKALTDIICDQNIDDGSRQDFLRAIMHNRNFDAFSTGTNRMVFVHRTDESIVLKVPFKQIALFDNIREMKNQYILRPFVSKCFDVSDYQSVGIYQRVRPIITPYEISYIAKYIYFNIIKKTILGQGFVMDDIGFNAYKNYGVNNDGIPVLLDFPYMYKVLIDRALCRRTYEGRYCNGTIVYSGGFDKLECDKCGTIYKSSDIGMDLLEIGINDLAEKLIYKGGNNSVKDLIYEFRFKDGTVIRPKRETSSIVKPTIKKEKGKRLQPGDLSKMVSLYIPEPSVMDVSETYEIKESQEVIIPDEVITEEIIINHEEIINEDKEDIKQVQIEETTEVENNQSTDTDSDKDDEDSGEVIVKDKHEKIEVENSMKFIMDTPAFIPDEDDEVQPEEKPVPKPRYRGKPAERAKKKNDKKEKNILDEY